MPTFAFAAGLTSAQLGTLKTAIAADGTLAALPNDPDSNPSISDAFNAEAVPTFWPLRPSPQGVAARQAIRPGRGLDRRARAEGARGGDVVPGRHDCPEQLAVGPEDTRRAGIESRPRIGPSRDRYGLGSFHRRKVDPEEEI